MNFDEAFSCLLSRQAPCAGAGGEAFARLLERLGNPQSSFSIVHVAGTNGKGTVCTLLAHALACAGHKTGLFISPHLVHPTERIQLNGQPVPPETFAQLVQTVLQAEQEPLNFFEILTACALVYFARQSVSCAVLETGLGGRRDPTNVCLPRACIITSIGLDHTQFLGSRLEQIAAEKAGIIKPGVPVWCGPLPPAARAVIVQTARRQNAPLYEVHTGEPFYVKQPDFARGQLLLARAGGGAVYPLHTLGACQGLYACLVWQVARFLGVDGQPVLKAFETVHLPGRFEIIPHGKTTFILDGAHNPQAVEGLMNFWQQTPFAARGALVCGFMKDKDYPHMLSLLAPHFKQIFLTQPPSPRAAPVSALNSCLRGRQVVAEPALQQALRRAAGAADTVLCTGSFYLAGAVREKLIKF